MFGLKHNPRPLEHNTYTIESNSEFDVQMTYIKSQDVVILSQVWKIPSSDKDTPMIFLSREMVNKMKQSLDDCDK